MATLTIVFDLDGTLVDTAPDLIDSLNVLFAREGIGCSTTTSPITPSTSPTGRGRFPGC